MEFEKGVYNPRMCDGLQRIHKDRVHQAGSPRNFLSQNFPETPHEGPFETVFLVTYMTATGQTDIPPSFVHQHAISELDTLSVVQQGAPCLRVGDFALDIDSQ